MCYYTANFNVFFLQYVLLVQLEKPQSTQSTQRQNCYA